MTQFLNGKAERNKGMRGRYSLVAAAALCLACDAMAGRPLTIDDADPVEAGGFEIEAGAAYEHDPDCNHWDFPLGLTFGMMSGAEIGIGFGGQFEERTRVLENCAQEKERVDGIGDLTLGFKWRFIESCPLGVRHALAPSVKFPTADEGKELGSGRTDYDFAWIASRSLGDRASVHMNLGYSWIGGPDDDIIRWGAALDFQILDALQWVGEVFAERQLSEGSDAVWRYNTGFRWSGDESLTLDMAAGSGISGDAPDIAATLGLTWAFGLPTEGKEE